MKKKRILSCFEQNLIDKIHAHWPKCENMIIFLPLRFYVKSNLTNYVFFKGIKIDFT